MCIGELVKIKSQNQSKTRGLQNLKKKKKRCSFVFLCMFQSFLLREFTTIGVASIYCDQIYNRDGNEYSTIAQSHRSSTFFFLIRLLVTLYMCNVQKRRIIKTIVFLRRYLFFATNENNIIYFHLHRLLFSAFLIA